MNGLFLINQIKRLNSHMLKFYGVYSFLANSLVAISVSGLTLLGVISTSTTVAVLITWGVIFATMFAIGKWLDQEVEDLDKVGKHDHHADGGGRCGKDKESL